MICQGWSLFSFLRACIRYRQAYIPLPLDGVEINSELVKTFRPQVDSSSSGLKFLGQTRYSEDFGPSVHADCRGVNCKPKQLKHVRDNDQLMFKDSITHEQFTDLSHLSKPRESFRPQVESIATGKFAATTRYTEEFAGHPMPLGPTHKVKVADDSSRVQGNCIPNKLRDYMYNNDIDTVSVLGKPVRSILNETDTAKAKTRSKSTNPYIDEYLTYYRMS